MQGVPSAFFRACKTFGGGCRGIKSPYQAHIAAVADDTVLSASITASWGGFQPASQQPERRSAVAEKPQYLNLVQGPSLRGNAMRAMTAQCRSMQGQFHLPCAPPPPPPCDEGFPAHLREGPLCLLHACLLLAGLPPGHPHLDHPPPPPRHKIFQ